MESTISNENLPKSMRYGMTSATAVPAVATLSRFASVNGSSGFSPSGSNQIRFKIQSPGFLDVCKHYLEFKVNVTGTDADGFAAYVDGHAGSFFDRLRIESNGAVVEEVLSYGLYNGIRHTYNSGLGEVMKDSAQSGSGRLCVKNVTTAIGLAAADTAAAVKAVTDAAQTANNGRIFQVSQGALGAGIATTKSHVFTIQLESGLFKNVHKKALPEGMAEMDVILTLAGNAQALVSAAAATYTIDNPTLFCPSFRIENADVMDNYRRMVQAQGASIHGITPKTYINTVSNGAGTKTLQINDRSLSVLGFVSAVRTNAADSTDHIYANSAYGYSTAVATTQMTRFKYQIAGINYPQSDINIATAADGRNLSRAHEESLKALAMPGEEYAKSTVSIDQLTGQIDAAYASSVDTQTTEVPKGLLSVDLKKFDMEKLKMVGLNTSRNSGPSVLEIEVGTTMGADTNCTTFALCEALFTVLPNGVMTVAV
jgi:hypothetical protein